ncbi:MAG: hypothetical protein MJZ66_01655 [Bacteroidales bacterium]|nr:hypothetical protein [Bacteroidales bacterium]
MERITVYCQKLFWEGFLKNFSKTLPLPTNEQIERSKSFMNLFQFLVNSNLVFDYKFIDFLEKTTSCNSPLQNGQLPQTREEIEAMHFQQIVNNYNAGLCGLDFQKDLLSDIAMDDKKLSSVYCLFKTPEECEDLSQKFGVLAIPTLDNYTDYNYLFKDNGKSMPKGEKNDWTFVKRLLKSPFNALVIEDNYIHDDIDNNLLPLLGQILPDKLGVDFHLSIFTNLSETVKVEDLYGKVEKYIQQSKPDLKFVLNIFNDNPRANPKQFHDRKLFTNYAVILSGAGFNPNNKKNQSENLTDINVLHPYFNQDNDWITDSHENYFKVFKSLFVNSSLFTGGNRYSKYYYKEPKTNRLLS